MDGLGLLVEQELNVVDESQQQAREFVVQVILVFLHQFCAGQRQEGCLERLCRFCFALLITKRRNGMFLILGLG